MTRCLTRAALGRTLVYNSVTAALLVLLAVSCGTTGPQRPPGIPQPDIAAGLATEVFFGSGSSAPATVAVRVRNNADVPITVTSIEIDSSSMAEWGLLRQTRMFRAAIPAKSEKELSFSATAVTLVRPRTEPLSFNVRVQFEAEGKHWQQFLRVIGTTPPM